MQKQNTITIILDLMGFSRNCLFKAFLKTFYVRRGRVSFLLQLTNDRYKGGDQHIYKVRN